MSSTPIADHALLSDCTATRPRSSPTRARSTGSASLASTRRPPSRGCWTTAPAISRSRPPASSAPRAATSTRRWSSLCTFWLAEAWALAGEVERARETFEKAAAFANDLGLLSEEVDPGSREMLGNFPQAFSHIGLINAAWAIAQAQQRAASAVPVGTVEAPGSGS